MLVLTRKLRESINVGDDIKIVILEVNKNQVRVGIDAPAYINIKRSELKQHETTIDLNIT